MIHSNLNVKEISVEASLKTIIKHHAASKIFINIGSPEKYIKCIKIYILPVNESTIFPAYAYNTIVDKTFPQSADKSIHQNNILAMVQNLIELEWNFVMESRQRIELSASSENINMSENALYILNDLNRLLEIKKKFILGTEIRINPKLTSTVENKKPKLITDLQILVDGNQQEKRQIIDLLITNRIQELSSPHFSFLSVQLSISQKLTQRKVRNLINSVTFHQSIEDLTHLFKKRVCNLVWHYMRTEMGWKGKKKTLDENQGEFIYTILLLFNLMRPEDLIRHHSPRDKANYIWSFFKTDPKYKDVKFPEIIFKEFTPEIHLIKRHLKRKKQILSGKN